LLETYLL